jgi:hypothetical protein
MPTTTAAPPEKAAGKATNTEKKKTTTLHAETTTATCHGCQQAFSSRNAIFKHLEETNGACLSASDFKDFLRFHDASKLRSNSKKNKNKHFERVVILYGYLPELTTATSSATATKAPAAPKQGETSGASENEDDGAPSANNTRSSSSSSSSTSAIRNGHDAADLLLEIMWQVDNNSSTKIGGTTGQLENCDSSSGSGGFFSYQRSYGNSNRQTHIVAQDDGTGAVSEVMATKLLPLVPCSTALQQRNPHLATTTVTATASTLQHSSGDGNDDKSKNNNKTVTSARDAVVEDWVKRVNQAIEERLNASSNGNSSSNRRPVLRVFGRQKLSGACAKFNAELDVAHRHVEYLLPADFLYNPRSPSSTTRTAASSSSTTHLPGSCFDAHQSRLAFFQSFATFNDAPRYMPDWERQQRDGSRFPHPGTRNFMHAIKKIMQTLTTQIVKINVHDEMAVLEKQRHAQRRMHSRGNKTNNVSYSEDNPRGHHQQDDDDDANTDIGNSDDDGDSNKESNERDDHMATADAAAAAATVLAKTKPDIPETQQRQPSPPIVNNNDDANVSRSLITTKQPATKKQRCRERRMKKAKKRANKKDEEIHIDLAAAGSDATVPAANSGKGKNMLQRKRYHNFTPTVMAHEYLAYRRLDRLYHRATLRFDQDEEGEHNQNGFQNNNFGTCHVRRPSLDHNNNNIDASENAIAASCRPFFSICLTGDIFLQGQVCRVLGLFIALVRGVVDEDFVDCAFDPQYPHLVQTPPLPSVGLYAVDALYMAWEGKAKAIFSPRASTRYPDGFNQDSILQAVDEWHTTVRECTAQAWLLSSTSHQSKNDIGDDNKNDVHRLAAEKEWTANVLEPWGVKAREQLQEYRKWKKATAAAAAAAASAPMRGTYSRASRNVDMMSQSPAGAEPALMEASATDIVHDADAETAASLVPSLDAVDPTVPEIFQEVLYHLRLANDSGLWPTTTPKRQLVMISSLVEQSANGAAAADEGQAATAVVGNHHHPTSLSLAIEKAKSNKDSRVSPYVFAEGEGGASGSFSVGAMPEDYAQPKGNQLFPELTKAAFKLEGLLCKGREPSSTIAINRNAQFRPYVVVVIFALFSCFFQLLLTSDIVVLHVTYFLGILIVVQALVRARV